MYKYKVFEFSFERCWVEKQGNRNKIVKSVLQLENFRVQSDQEGNRFGGAIQARQERIDEQHHCEFKSRAAKVEILL